MSTRRLDGPAFTMLVALAVLWGGSFVLHEVILTAIPVFTLVALRVGLAAVILWLVIGLSSISVPMRWTVWGALALMGLCNNAVPFSLIVWGQTAITGGLAAILNATTPLFAGLLAGLMLPDERLTLARIVGILLGVAGVVVMIGSDALDALGTEVAAQLAILGAALSYGVSAVYGRRFKVMGVPPIVIAAGQTTMSTLILVPLAFLVERPFAMAMPGAGVWLAVLVLAALCTALAYILYFAILSRAGATNAALVTVLVPVVAVLIGAATLGEAITASELAGMVLIGFGLLVIDGRAAEFASATLAPRRT